MEVGRWLIWMEWRPARLSVCLPLMSPLAHLLSHGKGAVKWLCMCVYLLSKVCHKQIL